MFIDTHCHFDFPPFVEQADFALQQAEQAGLKGIIVPTVTVDRFDLVMSLSTQHSLIYAALGLHPIYHHQLQDLEHLATLLTANSDNPKLVALGEIGLDNYVKQPELNEQYNYFREQLILAKQFELPVMLHSRHAHDLLYKELKRANLPCLGVVHGFSGSLEQAKQFIRLGYAIGVGGVITYERAHKTRSAIAQLPLSSLILETDVPDMPLSGYQGQPNRPERIAEVFTSLCALRTEPADVIRQAIVDNTMQLFPRLNITL